MATRRIQSRGTVKTRRVLMADSVTIEYGKMVMINSAGLGVEAANTASAKGVVGVATVTKTSGTGGDDWIIVEYGVPYLFAATSITQAMVGDVLFVVDDETFDETASESIKAGVLVEFVSTTSGWLLIDPLAIV